MSPRRSISKNLYHQKTYYSGYVNKSSNNQLNIHVIPDTSMARMKLHIKLLDDHSTNKIVRRITTDQEAQKIMIKIINKFKECAINNHEQDANNLVISFINKNIIDIFQLLDACKYKNIKFEYDKISSIIKDLSKTKEHNYIAKYRVNLNRIFLATYRLYNIMKDPAKDFNHVLNKHIIDIMQEVPRKMPSKEYINNQAATLWTDPDLNARSMKSLSIYQKFLKNIKDKDINAVCKILSLPIIHNLGKSKEHIWVDIIPISLENIIKDMKSTNSEIEENRDLTDMPIFTEKNQLYFRNFKERENFEFSFNNVNFKIKLFRRPETTNIICFSLGIDDNNQDKSTIPIIIKDILNNALRTLPAPNIKDVKLSVDLSLFIYNHVDHMAALFTNSKQTYGIHQYCRDDNSNKSCILLNAFYPEILAHEIIHTAIFNVFKVDHDDALNSVYYNYISEGTCEYCSNENAKYLYTKYKYEYINCRTMLDSSRREDLVEFLDFVYKYYHKVAKPSNMYLAERINIDSIFMSQIGLGLINYLCNETSRCNRRKEDKIFDFLKNNKLDYLIEAGSQNYLGSSVDFKYNPDIFINIAERLEKTEDKDMVNISMLIKRGMMLKEQNIDPEEFKAFSRICKDRNIIDVEDYKDKNKHLMKDILGTWSMYADDNGSIAIYHNLGILLVKFILDIDKKHILENFWHNIKVNEDYEKADASIFQLEERFIKYCNQLKYKIMTEKDPENVYNHLKFLYRNNTYEKTHIDSIVGDLKFLYQDKKDSCKKINI